MKNLLLAATAAAALAAAAPAAAAPITFNFTGAIVTWTATETGTYEIVAIGAQGGAGTDGQTFAGGRGALIGGYFDLAGGTTLQLAVGGMGGSNVSLGAGGGGSFVVGPGTTPLVIAGGGGGIRSNAHQNGWDANTGQAGLSGSGFSTTGGGAELLSMIGQGGPATFVSFGSSGGGFNSAGASDSPYGTGGASWAGGLAGGVNLNCGSGGHGGFGGGGAGAGCQGGGGGGGYSGGQGGFIAGGGGSFNADVLTGWSQAGAGVGHRAAGSRCRGARGAGGGGGRRSFCRAGAGDDRRPARVDHFVGIRSGRRPVVVVGGRERR
jgi:hypothetical protein